MKILFLSAKNNMAIESAINKQKEVVVILPYIGNKVLMQLRDLNHEIAFSGHWGFFGGSIENCESPEKAASRELYEEIGYNPSNIHKLEKMEIVDMQNLVSHFYYCLLKLPVEEIVLREGIDLGLFTVDEVMRRKLYSRKVGKAFPVIPSPYMELVMRKLWRKIYEMEV